MRSLLISAAYLCVATYLAECSCEIRTIPFTVYHTPSSGVPERCKVDVNYCEGDCYTYYEHHPHLTDYNYDSPDDDCKWSSQYCRIKTYDVILQVLYDCYSVVDVPSQFDPNVPWTVNVVTARSCACGTEATEQGAAHCPNSFVP